MGRRLEDAAYPETVTFTADQTRTYFVDVMRRAAPASTP